MRFLLLCMLLLVVVGCSNNLTGNVVASLDDVPDDAQIVLLGIDGRSGSYTFNPATIEAGKKTVLKNDGTLAGCAVALVQPELGIRTNFALEDTYTFTPEKPGTYRFACSMNMWSGELEVI